MLSQFFVFILECFKQLEKIIRLVRTQNFTQNGHFLTPDTHTYVLTYTQVRVRIRW